MSQTIHTEIGEDFLTSCSLTADQSQALSSVYPELVSRSVREGTFIFHSYPLSSDIEELNEPFPYTTGEGQLGKLPSFPSSDDGSL